MDDIFEIKQELERARLAKTTAQHTHTTHPKKKSSTRQCDTCDILIFRWLPEGPRFGLFENTNMCACFVPLVRSAERKDGRKEHSLTVLYCVSYRSPTSSIMSRG
jgi:hypothetical protein